MNEQIILVDENDNQIGTEEKLKAHEDAKLHRAFSILVFNSKNELLLQKRADSKYHAGGLWTNTCCSHPRNGETLKQATSRRLQEEMGFICPIKEIFSFIYKTKFDNGLTEHEFDHIFVGRYDNDPTPNPDEVGDYKWSTLESISNDIDINPKKYTPWFAIIIKEHLDKLENYLKTND